MAKTVKTNAMRILDSLKIDYCTHEYNHDDGLIDGLSIAQKTGQPPGRVFKTLVTHGSGRNFYVFVIPVAEELNLKAAAKEVGEKSVSMLHVKDLLPTTGYIRGGCSPIGMKKPFPTVIHSSCLDHDTIMVSGGKIGTQIEIAPADLLSVINGKTADITV